MKKKLCIVFGGKSVEHEISIISANAILNHIDQKKYIVYGVFVGKNGVFYESIAKKYNKKLKFQNKKQNKVTFLYGDTKDIGIIKDNKIMDKRKIDIFFPLIHGTGGEDGSIQGLLETINKPYIGCNVESSSICMNKILTKKILSNESIRTTKFYSYAKDEWKTNKTNIIKKIVSDIKFPCFVKASNLGSSVGVYKVKNKSDLKSKIQNTFKFSNKVLVEEAVINPEEVEVSVLQGNQTIVSKPGRVISSDEFYTYKAKYLDGKSSMEIPYKRSLENRTLSNEIKETSIKIYKILQCTGMARIDFLFGKTSSTKKSKLYLSEVNTIPGFTEISMFPKLLNEEGLELKEIINILIQSSEVEFKKKQKLITNFV